MLTRRVIGQSIAAVCKECGESLTGWKAYFRISETSRVFVDIDKWVRHRLQALPPSIGSEIRLFIASRVPVGCVITPPTELQATADGVGITLRWTSTSRYRTSSAML